MTAASLQYLSYSAETKISMNHNKFNPKLNFFKLINSEATGSQMVCHLYIYVFLMSF